MNSHQTWYMHKYCGGLVWDCEGQFLTELYAQTTFIFSFPDENLTELFARNTSVSSFRYNNLSKSQWIFTKLDMCIDIVEIGLGLLMGKFDQFLTVICP